MKILINKLEVEVNSSSLGIEDAIGERSTASFVVIDKTGTYHFEQGQPVEVYDDENALIYAGVIDKPVEKVLNTVGLTHSITCKDWHYLCDKRIIARAYENVNAVSVIQDIVTSYLSAEGITTGLIEDGGHIINEAVFNYVPVSKAIESIAEKVGFIWYIDQYKKLFFMSRNTNTSPWILTQRDILKNSSTVENGNPRYRNKQYVKGGKDITDPMTQSFKGDGKNKAYTLGYQVAKVPTIMVNSTVKTVGIKGVDSNKDWYWSKGDSVILQSDSAVPLTSADTLQITYQGLFDIVVITYDNDQIQERKLLEENSGIVEDVTDEPDTTNRDAAFQIANSKLRKYAVIGRRLKFITTRKGLKPGQLLTVTLLQHSIISCEMLIESICISYLYPLTYYEVICVEGPEQSSWTKMFEQMATRGQAFVIRENISEKQILVTLNSITKQWLESSSPNIMKVIYPSSIVTASSTTFPSFDFKDRLKYIEVIDSTNNVLLRKKVTKQTGQDTNNITSVFFVAPFEGNGLITKLKFYGGSNASDMNSSGVLVDEVTFSRQKVELEAIQIERYDNKG